MRGSAVPRATVLGCRRTARSAGSRPKERGARVLACRGMILVGLLLGLLFVTPFVVTYVVFIRWCDRFEPEPWWLVASAFVWGAFFATIGGGLSSGIVQAIVESSTGAGAHDAGIEAFG